MKGKHISKFNSTRLIIVALLGLILAIGISMAFFANHNTAKADEANETTTITLQKTGTDGSFKNFDGEEISSLTVDIGMNYAIYENALVVYDNTYSTVTSAWAIPATTSNFTGWTLSTAQSSGTITGEMQATASFVSNPAPYYDWGYVCGIIQEQPIRSGNIKPLKGATVTFLPDRQSNMTEYYGITNEYGIFYFRVPLNVPGDAIVFANKHDTSVKRVDGFTEQVNIEGSFTIPELSSYSVTAFSNDEGHDQFRYFYYVNDKLSWTTYNTSLHDQIKSFCNCEVIGNDLVVTWNKIGDPNPGPYPPSEPVFEKGVVTPMPKEGYEFTGWTIKGNPIVEPFAIEGPIDFEAHYQPVAVPDPSETAKTGDNTTAVAMLILAVLSAASVGFVVSRKRFNK